MGANEAKLVQKKFGTSNILGSLPKEMIVR